jgi:hypothetical protein
MPSTRILRVAFRDERRKPVKVQLRRTDDDVYESDGDVEVSFDKGRSIKVYAMYSPTEGDEELMLTVEEAGLQTLAVRCFSGAVISYITRFDEECIFYVGDLPDELGGPVR